ncbi:MAG: Crp/Fnr family transcriptional regulator [Allosphingosinicella sp.]|uniref:Crp/Fnr family transcriptional regulator n=1 Tax=Allosphingosinicella sp. TaxID=2823234 RepID=UPI0039291DF6
MLSPPDSHPLAPMLRKLSLWGALADEDRHALLELPHIVRALGPASHVVREGDRAEHCCLLVSGYAYRHKVVGDGGRQILAVHMAGDLIDLQNALLRTADHNIQALGPVRIAQIPREAIREIAFGRPAVGMALWYDTLVDGSIHREWTTNVGRRDARTRMAHFLCEFGVRLEAAGLGRICEYELPMTQEQLADALGLTAVHVNRTLKGLDRDGFTRRAKRSVFIRDWDRLADAGDFTSDYLHLPEAA